MAPVNGSKEAAAPIASRGGWPPRAIGPTGPDTSAGPSGSPRPSDSTSRDRSSSGSRNVPVQVPPCQMLKTAMPVSEYQLRRILRELPRTSKKTSPSRGKGAASDDMLPMVAPPAERLST